MTDDTGSAVVELALVLPLFLVVLLGVVEVGVLVRTQLEVVNAAREGARQAAVDPDPGRAAGVVRESLGELASRARISVERGHVVGGRARVTVKLRHTMAAPVFGGIQIELRGASTMRVER